MSRRVSVGNGKFVTEKSAQNVTGILIRTISPEKYFFRVYRSDGNFDDYKLRFSDLEITIGRDQLVSFYEDENGELYLDETPETLGLEIIAAT